MSGCCPRCERPLTEDGHLRYCDRCGYEPPESAALPITPPLFEDADDSEPRPPAVDALRATSPRGK